MKNLLSIIMLVFFFAVAATTGTSCNNAKKSAQNAADSLATSAKNTVQSFASQVSNFDSTWTSTMMVLNQRINQWDSTAKTYKGPVKMKMEKQLAALKMQRDSLKSLLGTAGSRAQGGWTNFTQSVSSKYDTILATMDKLSTANQ